MCGITGFVSQKYNRDQLIASTQSIAHRGPNGEGFFFETTGSGWNCGLGHRRLSIIDLSNAASQPMQSHCGRYMMVFNGEIYNYKEIKDTRFPGASWHSTGDTEVIIESFAKYGPECFQWLNGMFAIAIWDKQLNKLTLARDHIGIKPVFYTSGNEEIIFASEIKAIQAIKKDFPIDQFSIPAFLHLGYIPHPHTIYNGITKLSAGSYLEVLVTEAGNLYSQEFSFWKIRNKISHSVLKDETVAKKQLNYLLTDSVRKQLISDVPIGTFLSGGTDSSLLTAIASQVADQKVKTFSIAVTDGKINEAPYAAAVAKHLQTEHYELPITQREILEMIPGFLQTYDEPFSDSSAFPTMMVSKLARQYVTVALSGDGGDELFLGYGSYLWAKRLKNPLLRAGAPLFHAGSQWMPSRYKRIGKLFAGHPASHFQSHLFSQDHYYFTEKEISTMLLNPVVNFDEFNYTFSERKLTVTEQASFWDIENYLKDNLLVKVDRASMKYSLETRVPLLDYRIVEFALNLSPSLKIHSNGMMKYLLKQVLYDYVPRPLLERPKWGFGVPLVKWLKTDLKWLVDKYCSREVVEACAIVRYDEVARLIKRYHSGSYDYLYNRIWALTVLHWFLYEHKG
jgi:asparagine synthase (glutamine-hydrolysing)